MMLGIDLSDSYLGRSLSTNGTRAILTMDIYAILDFKLVTLICLKSQHERDGTDLPELPMKTVWVDSHNTPAAEKYEIGTNTDEIERKARPINVVEPIRSVQQQV